MLIAGTKRPVLHAQHRLDQARDAGRFQRVADVGLDAGDRNLLAGRKFRARISPSAFSSVASPRLVEVACASMYCKRGHVEAVAIGALHGLDLAFLARGPQAFAAAVGRHAHAQHDGLNRVAVGQCPRQGLEHQAT